MLTPKKSGRMNSSMYADLVRKESTKNISINHKFSPQEYDFICFDENGLVIEHSTEFDDLEDLTQETQETNINEVHDKPTEREEDEPSKISVQDVSDQNSPKTTEKGGSSWIGSAVSGWFGRNEQSNDEPQDEGTEESFKSRKIVMDIEENHVEEKTNSGTFGWIRGELTNAFGFGNEDLKTDTQDNVENPTIDKDTSSQQSSSWISMGGDVLDFSEDNTPAATKPEAEMADENTNMEDQSILNPSENMDVDDKIQGDENKPDDSVENEDGPMENMRSDKEKVEEQTGWYGNMYNRITNLYKEEQTKQDEDDEGKESLSEEESPGFVTNIENIETKESESQSIFSVSGLTSVLKLPFQGDTVVKRDEEKTAKEEDPGKEDFEEQNNNEDQEARMLTDIDEQDSIPINNDVLSETQSLSDKTKDSIAFDSTEESSMTEDSTDKSADNSNEEVKSANNPDVLEGEVEQDMRDVRSDEEKSTKEVDSGKEDFLEQQKLKKEEMSDVDEQELTPKDVDLISETRALSDETMTLKDSDDVIKIDVFSQESNSQNDDDDKSANNTADEVIQNKNNLTDSSDDTSEDRLTQSLSDQDNLDTIKQQESDYDKISTDTVTGADTSELAETDIYNELHDQKTQESNVNADVNSELNVDALSEYINENKLAEDDQGTSKEDDVLIMERNNELVMDRNNELGMDKNDKLVKDRKDELVMDKNDKLVKDRNDDLDKDRNDELVMDKNDKLDKDRNYDLVKDRNDELVMDRYEAQLDEALSKDMFHEEKLSDSEALEMSSEHKLDTKISPLDEGTSHIPTLGTDELAVISEENIHSDLESNSALNATDDEMDNTSVSHDVLLQTAGTSIVKDTDSEGKNADEVVVNGERKDLGQVSEPTENYFETKELKGDTQITNETLIEETHTKSPSLNTSNGSPDSEDDVHDLSLPENADYTSSEVTKLTDDFFLENVPVQDGNINNMVDQNQSVEHKEETDTANKEDQTDLESVTKREESDTGATWDQKEDDMAVQSEYKEKQGDEEQPEIQDKKTFNYSTETSKEYTNLYPHLSEQNIQDLLHLFGDHKLSWLDSKMGNTDAGQDNEDLDELSEFEQLLEYHMKMNTKLGHIQQDNGFPGQNNIKEYPALQKLFTILSTLREKYSPVITEVSVESPGTDDSNWSFKKKKILLKSMADDRFLNFCEYCMG